ncbi:MAG TPA: septum formation initiator family protein [Stellaceae bacterium]|jgi:cell division protein FtsB|nr:septum formation initiator family protein [Stellaceae bacterium]
MEIGRTLRRQLRSVLAPTIGLSLSAYFGYHLVEGDRGLYAWVNLTKHIHDTQIAAGELHDQRSAEQRRVSMLRPTHLDPDLLDEQARRALNLAGPNDVVILNSSKVRDQ